MEYIILIIFLILMLVILKIVCKINIKQIEIIGKNNALDEKVRNYPSNIDICRKILKKLNNENVTIEEDKQAKSCLYIVTTNKILIGDTKQSFTRIQTIAHECLHSIQDKRMLMFNFIYSNIYLLTFIVLCILSLFDILTFKMMFISIHTNGFHILLCKKFFGNRCYDKGKIFSKRIYGRRKNIK